jgi:hypothetical protein
MGSCKSKSISSRQFYIPPQSYLSAFDFQTLERILKRDEELLKRDIHWNDNFISLIRMLEYPLTNEEYLRELRHRIDSFLNIITFTKNLNLREKQTIVQAFEEEYKSIFMTRFLVERPSRRQVVPIS